MVGRMSSNPKVNQHESVGTGRLGFTKRRSGVRRDPRLVDFDELFDEGEEVVAGEGLSKCQN